MILPPFDKLNAWALWLTRVILALGIVACIGRYVLGCATTTPYDVVSDSVKTVCAVCRMGEFIMDAGVITREERDASVE